MANLLLLLSSRFAAVVKAYFGRVGGDGGTTVSKQHAQEVYTDTNPYDPTLIQSCDSGKATVLYSMIPSQSLLLYQYTGAAAAYSLRSLSAGTTNVVKVRRSSDDAELDFTATEVSDGTLASWVTAGGGTEDGFVTTWYDQSGNTNNATQATAANQPKIVSSGSLVTENGKAALDFDGTDDYLSVSTVLANSVANSANKVIAILSKSNSIASRTRTLFFGNSTSTRVSFINEDNNTFDGSFGGYLNRVSIAFNITQQYLAFCQDISGEQAFYLNSSTSGSNSLGDQFNDIDNADIGASSANSQFHDGTIQELIFYASDQSANRTGIEANINAHYSIYS